MSRPREWWWYVGTSVAFVVGTVLLMLDGNWLMLAWGWVVCRTYATERAWHAHPLYRAGQCVRGEL